MTVAWRCTIAGMLVTSLAPLAHSQGVVEVRAAQNVFIAENGRILRAGDQDKSRLERRLALLIDDMQRSCNLSEAQTRKLRVAAKGAIAASMERQRARDAAMRGAMQRGIGGLAVVAPQPPAFVPAQAAKQAADDATKEDVPAEQKAANEDAQENADADEGWEVVAGNLDRPVPFHAGNTSVTNVVQEPRWVKAVDSVLTEDQRKVYRETQARRREERRRAAIDALMARADTALLLSPEQKTSLRSLLAELFGDRFAEMGPNQGRGVIVFGGMVPPKPVIDPALLKGFLSEPQIAEWQAVFEPELRAFAGANVRAARINAFRFPFVPGAIAVQRAAAPAEEPEDKKPNQR